jgi:3-hydroxyacyl-[acyl-carrier-protein] dehydratase
MRFHLIDRVDAYEPGAWVRGRKLTSRTEEYWEDSGDGEVMPTTLVLEALCQAGTWLIITTTDRRKRAALLSVGSVTFNGDIRPGDVIELEGKVESMNDEMAVLSGSATVEGRSVMEVSDIMCTLIDADTLEDLESTKRMQDLIVPAGGA